MTKDSSTPEASLKRPPLPALRPFVKLLWAADEKKSEGLARPERERLLPTGSMHLVLRLSDDPIRIYRSISDCRGEHFNRAVIGGLRAGFYVKGLKGLTQPVRTVGALLEPGASLTLFGAAADELAERHTALEDLWGAAAHRLWEALHETGDLTGQLDIFEHFLLARLPRACGLHPAIAHALVRFSSPVDIATIVAETGYSHRRFIELFRRNVGLPPRLYTRVLRFQQCLKLMAQPSPIGGEISWADLAYAAGFSDQAHFNREFREFSGVTPTEYRRLATRDSHHVPILETAGSRGQFRSIRSPEGPGRMDCRK